MQWVLRPHVGTANVAFGMNRDQVQSALGEPLRQSAKRQIFEGLVVHFDNAGTVWLLEVDGALGGEGIFEGTNLLALDAEAALAFVARLAEVNQSGSEYPMLCVFPDLDLALWRRCMPEDDPSGEGGRRFDTVSIGARGARLMPPYT